MWTSIGAFPALDAIGVEIPLRLATAFVRSQLHRTNSGTCQALAFAPIFDADTNKPFRQRLFPWSAPCCKRPYRTETAFPLTRPFPLTRLPVAFPVAFPRHRCIDEGEPDANESGYEYRSPKHTAHRREVAPGVVNANSKGGEDI